ncbi:MAG: anthranilate phosphoribosyltransferase, partial [Betaproteobacteria bacterium]|nr:anthranilate phosphoribosyltransferase [Betaproteobacteria bacterium]
GSDGLDEITITGDTDVAELRDGKVAEYRVNPAQFGLSPSPIDGIRVDSIEAAKAMLLGVLDDRPGAPRDIVALNAGAAIYVSALAPSLDAGVRRALEVIASGAAKAKLAQLVAFTRQAAA